MFAQAVADFKTNYINDTMNNDQKIRAGYDYIKNNVTYIDWRESTYANTAYGCLVEKKAACSGMTRTFVALIDAVDVKSYWIHAVGNDHPWNMAEFNDEFYFIDIDANIASCGEFIYKAATHPYSYDTAAYPAIGSKSGSNTSGIQVTEGWVQDNAGWWYRNADGSYPANVWKSINGKWYYFEANGYMAANKWINGTYYVGADGAMLTNTTTPDGYQVGADGAWVQNGGQQSASNDGVHTKRASDPSLHSFGITIEGRPYAHERIDYFGLNCMLLDTDEFNFKFESSENEIDPNGHEVWLVGYTSANEIPFAIGEPKVIPFEYDKEYMLDYTGSHSNAESFSQYCKQNDLVISISIVDSCLNGNTNHNALTVYGKYR